MNPLLIILNSFATFLFLYSVIAYEPPAFIAFVFGACTGFIWAFAIALWIITKAGEDNDRD